MASSSSGSRRYDVFPSFSGEDVRKSFLSHLLKELDRKSIRTFRDHGIERSRPIGPELLLAIRESRIAIVIFSKKYASSTWCLNELVEIHKCYKELNQMVIPIFYKVNPSEVGKQTGDFGKVFKETCEGKLEDQKQIWMQTLADVAKMAGEDLQNWPDEAAMIEKITNDVFNKLITPSQRFGDFLGIETHIEAMKPMLSLESEEAIMVGILGPSGIGKTTIARALFSQLSSQFHYHAFVSYKRTQRDDYGMKLFWEKQFLSEILDQKDLKLCHFGMVEQKLNHKKVLIVLDDVDDLELLKTLVGKTGWFGPGSLIIVITQDRRLLKAHEIDLIYEVEFPSKDLALKMLSRSAFGQNSPPGDFMELAIEMAELAGNLPLGLNVLGSSLKGSSKGKWIEMMPRLRNDLDGDIEKTLRLSYDRLARQDDRELFLYIACFLRLSEGIGFYERTNVGYIIEFFGDSVNNGLTMLADKSLIRITSNGTIEMHNLLQRLGRRIVRAESNDNNPGKHVFLVDVEDIREVLTEKTGTESVQGIYLNKSDIIEPFFIYKKSFKGMLNLQFLIVCTDRRQDGRQEREGGLYLPQGLAYLPRKLRLLYWSEYPSKCLPSNFKAEFLVELTMVDSKLEKLWEGTQPLGRLKRMFMNGSRYLKEIPDLSKAINLEELYLCECESLVTLTSSIQNAIKLRKLDMENCTKLESIPALLNLESLESLKLKGCFQLRNFPQVSLYKLIGQTHETMIKVEDCLWNKNHHGVDFLDSLMRCIPSQFRPEHLKYLTVKGSMLEKLWEGVQSLGKLKKLELLECGNLKEIPDLSKATNLETLKIIECTGLEILPTDVNLSSLKTLDLRGCKRLRSFPQISWNIIYLYLNDTAIEEVPCCIENFWRLNYLWMRGCKRLKNISPNIFRLKRLKGADFSECVEVVTALSYASMVETTEDHSSLSENIFDDHLPNKYFWRMFFSYGFKFNNCFNLDGDARELILRSFLRPTFLPGGNVPKYFTHRSSTNSLTVTLPQSSLSQEFLGFKACVVLEAITNPKAYAPYLAIHWHFRGVYGWHHKSLKMDLIYNLDHLVLVPFKLAPPSKLELDYISSSSKWDYNDVEFWFSLKGHSGPLPSQRIKGCGIRVLDLSPSPASSDGSKMPML